MLLNFIDLTCNGIMAGFYINDTTMPSLLTFVVDMNTGILYLTFDETVNISSFRSEELTLIDAINSDITNYSLQYQGNIITDSDSYIIALQLSEEDINAIKFDNSMFTTAGNAFITFTTSVVMDMSGNMAMVRDISSALGAAGFLADNESPNLISYDLNLNSNFISLTFDESVSKNVFNPTVITLLNDDGDNFTRSYQIQGIRGTEVISSLGTIVIFNMSVTDQNELKAYEDFATEPSNTFLSVQSSLTIDRSRIGNPNRAINATFPLQATRVISDTVQPSLVSFLQFNLEDGSFRLLFNKPVNISSIIFDRISIITSPSENRHLFGGKASYVDNSLRTQIEIELSPEDLAYIKLNGNLATQSSTTMIQVESGAIQDQNGNNVVDSIMTTQSFLHDLTGPHLMSFTLDLNVGSIIITFDDVVQNEPKQSTIPIDISGISIQIDANGIQDKRVGLTQQPDQSDITNSSNGYITVIFIPHDDLNRLKALGNLATNIGNTYLTLSAITISDVLNNRAVPVTRDNALQASEVVPDTTSPQLIAFNLDLNGLGVLELIFDEAVAQVNLDVTQVSIVGLSKDVFSISSVNFHPNPPVPSFSIILGEQDLNTIKSMPGLGSFAGNSRLIITSTAINDTSGNSISEIKSSLPLSVRTYTPDITNPQLRAYTLDMNEGCLVLTFTETVNGSSFDPTQITIANSADSTNGFQTLTGGNFSPIFSNVLKLNISIENLNSIKKIIDLADSHTNTFISLTSSTIRDMESNFVSNPILEVPKFQGQQVTEANYIFDRTSPQHVSFSLNLTSEELILTFDETVNASSLVIDLITIKSRSPTSDDMLLMDSSRSGLGMSGNFIDELFTEKMVVSTRLTSGSENGSIFINQDNTEITIILGSYDLYSLKIQTDIATGINNTFISFLNTTIADMSGNLVKPILATQPEQASSFYNDFVSPSLIQFDLNLTSQTILLVFSEVVNASSVDVSQFTLIAGPNMQAFNRTLTKSVNGSLASRKDGAIITIFLGANDLNEIKRLTNLGTSLSNSNLLFTSDAVRDMNANQVLLRDISEPLPVTLFSEDSVDPRLTAFNLDINMGIITLEFSETVNATSLNMTGIGLHSSAQGPSNQSIYFTGGSLLHEDGTRLVVNISRNDLNTIKFLTDLANSPETTYLSIGTGGVLDMNSNPVMSISQFDSIPVSTYIFDEIGPTLESFKLNLNTEVLSLFFDETVNVSSLVYMDITLQSLTDMPLAHYNLSGGQVLYDDNSPSVHIQLDLHDLNQIKLNRGLATGHGNTVVRLGSGIVNDLASIPNPSFPSTLSLDATQFISDTTGPRLLNFSVNINMETLTLNLNEPVNVSSLDATGITFLDDTNGLQYTLTGGNTTSPNGLQIIVNFADMDLNNLKKSESIMVSRETSFISISANVIADMNGNLVMPIFPQNAINANVFIKDTTRPYLEAFDLDLDSNIMTLEFVETVNISSINFNRIILQQASNSTNMYTLSDGVLLSLEDSDLITFRLVTEDLNAIKSQRIALNANTTWLIMDEGFILDQNMQLVQPILNGVNALHVRDYTSDAVAPTLDRFDLDLDANTLTLYFSETVNVVDTLMVSRFTLISEPLVPLVNNPIPHILGLDAMNTMSSDIYKPVVIINLGRLDLNRIKEQTDLGTNENNTYLILDTSSVQDMSANRVIEINIFDPLNVHTFIGDISPPQLEMFDLNMNTGRITLYFSESVNPCTLDSSQFTLQHSEKGIPSDYSYSFTGALAEPGFGPNITLELPISDLNEIKRISQLATSLQNTFIKVAEGGIQDMNRNFNQGITGNKALRVSDYVMDTTDPVITNFDLDLSMERLILTFDETINSSSFLESGFTIQSSKSSVEPNFRVLVGGRVLTADDTVVMIQLDASDLNFIKSKPNLATSSENTYLRLDSSAIRDMADNMVVDIINGRALSVKKFTADDHNPILIGFDLDLNVGTLKLTFNETVNVSSLAVENISLKPETLSLDVFTFNSTSETLSHSPNQPVVLIQIGSEDLNEIMRRLDLATNENNTYLELSTLSIQDTNQNTVIPTTLSVTIFTKDITSPVLTSYIFDLNEGRLHLTFSETVLHQTLNFTEITLQAEKSLSASVSTLNLSGGTLLTPRDGISLSIKLTKVDLDTIKSFRTLAMNRYSTFITLTENVVADASENKLVAVEAANASMVSVFIHDTTNPILRSFDLDMNIGTLQMTFSETVDTAMLMLIFLTVQNSVIMNNSFSFQSSTWSTELGPVVYINISKFDLDLLKENRHVATDISSTYISLTNLTIADTSGNAIAPISDENAQKAALYVHDVISPVLEMFELDMDSGELTLYYSETVDIFSLDPTKITFQNDAATAFTLTGGDVTLVDSTVGHVQLTTDDQNELKRLEDLSTCTTSDTFISLTSNWSEASTSSADFLLGSVNGSQSEALVENMSSFSDHVLDMAGNPVVAINTEIALQVTSTGCTEDTTRPMLANFTLNMHNGTLTLTFDETVNSSTLDLIEITFHNGKIDPIQTYQLRSGYANNDNLTGQTMTVIDLSNTDLNELKRRENLATGLINTQIMITQYLVLDMNLNQNVEITLDNSSVGNMFIADEKSPVLLSFDLDMTLEQLTLRFSETVNASSLNVCGITLQNQNSTSFRELEGGYFLTPDSGGPPLGPNDPLLVIQLDEADLNYIKAIPDLVTGLPNTFLAIQSMAIADMNGNMVEQVSSFAALQATEFQADGISPHLIKFDLDIDSGELSLYFSETVDVSSLEVSEITLQSDIASPFSDQFTFTPRHTRFDTFSNGSDSPIVFIQIGIFDLNEIKMLTQLATSNITTYLTISNFSVSDTSGNAVIDIRNGDATLVSLFTADTTSPVLENFNLNLNSGLLQLTFNEVVRLNSLNVSSIKLQNSSIITSSSVQLTGDRNTANLYDSPVMKVLINNDDLNRIKIIRSLATTVNNTYLSILAEGIEDMNGNIVLEVSSFDAIRADAFEEDGNEPILLNFDLDMDTGSIDLTFDETVEADSLVLSEITLQDDRPGTDNNTYTLTGGYSSNLDSTLLSVNLSYFDLNEIKRIRGLASDPTGSNSYISITNYTVRDMNNNPVQSVLDSFAIHVQNFTEDDTPAELDHFDLDMNLGRLTFSFSETVDATTFNISQYFLQCTSNASKDSNQSFTLIEENLVTGDGTQIIQFLLYLDLNSIKSISCLATNMDDTYLSITGMAIQDMNSNPIIPISEYGALKVNQYKMDITRPVLESFDLNMNNGQFSIFFPETVNVSMLDVTEIQLVNNASSGFVFTPSTKSSSTNWPTFIIDISVDDLNVIKSLLSLAVSNHTTFITLSELVIRDAAGNMNVETNATQVRVFTPDKTRPKLLSFNLDLTLDILTLTFDETVCGRTLMPDQLTLISGREDDLSASGSGSSGSTLGSMDYQVSHINYTLTGGENLPIDIKSTELRINLTFNDRNEIKRLEELATSMLDTYISITSNLVKDANMNPVYVTTVAQVNFFTPDKKSPQLLYFDLNMNMRYLTLVFSETVDVETLNITQISLQGLNVLANETVEYYELTDAPAPYASSSTSDHSSVITINIGEADANMIKFRTGLATSDSNAFIAITTSAIRDMNQNQVDEISDRNAAQVRRFDRDAMPPVLREFNLNLTSEELILSFDETVNILTLQSSLFRLHNSFSHNSTAYILRAVYPNGVNSPLVVVNLTASQHDLDGIKVISDLATDSNNTFLTLELGAISDLSQPPNPIKVVMRQVDNYFPDTTRPKIVMFSVNVNASTLILTFDEVVNSFSLNPGAIRLQNSRFTPSSSYIDLRGKLRVISKLIALHYRTSYNV